jgi:hypothetical protein
MRRRALACAKARSRQRRRKYQIPEGILYSVGLTETGRKGSLYPYAMNIEGNPSLRTAFGARAF